MRRTLPLVAATALSLTITAGAQAADYASRTLKVGSNGSDVRALQRISTARATTRTSTASSGPARGRA